SLPAHPGQLIRASSADRLARGEPAWCSRVDRAGQRVTWPIRLFLRESQTFRTSSREVATRCQPPAGPLRSLVCVVLLEAMLNATLLIVVKVAFVGAGSVEFTRNVVTDLCGYPELSGQLELSLQDISASRLEHAEALARRIAEQAGSGAVVTASA